MSTVQNSHHQQFVSGVCHEPRRKSYPWQQALSVKKAHHQLFITFYTQQVTWLLVTEVRSESFRLVTERRHYDAHPIYASFSYVSNVIFFIIKCGIAGFLCATCVFKVPASSSSLGYLCANCFFCCLHCWASPWSKIAYSINRSLTQSLIKLIDALGTEAFASE